MFSLAAKLGRRMSINFMYKAKTDGLGESCF